MEKYVDFCKGIPTDKFIVTDDGHVFNTYSQSEIHTTYDRINLNHYKSGKRVTFTFRLDVLVLMMFGEEIPVNMDSDFIWAFHRNGDMNDCNINNLSWCLNKTNIPIRDVFKIYDLLKMSIWDNIEISKRLGYFVNEYIITRITRTSEAEKCAEAFGYKLSDIRKNYPYKIKKPEKLTESEVKKICEYIVDNGADVDFIFSELCDNMPALTRGHIFDICNKKRFVKISDKYFDGMISLIRGENDPAKPSWPDLPDEIWKPILFDNLFEEDYFVSNKGRVRNTYGRILKPTLVRNTTLMVSLSKRGKRKLYSVRRLVMQSFSTNIAELLELDPDSFEVDLIDGDPLNNSVENLRWIPKGGRSKNNGYSIRDIDDIVGILLEYKDSKDREFIKERIKNEIHHNSTPSQINSVIRGHTYAYFTNDFYNMEWEPINFLKDVPKDTYYVSSSGLVRKNKFTLVPRINEYLDERNTVLIEGKKYYIDKLVAIAFKVKGHNEIKNKLLHLDQDISNDNVDNLKWVRNIPHEYNTTKTKYYYKYHESERWVLITYKDIIENHYMISTYGRVKTNDTGKFLKVYQDKYNNDMHVSLKRNDGRIKQIPIKSIIFNTFCPEKINPDIPENLRRIYFIDGDPTNCHYKNLLMDYRSICSKSENYDKDKRSRNVLKIDSDNNVVVRFNNAESAGIDANTSGQNIRQRIRNKTVIDGFSWVYE